LNARTQIGPCTAVHRGGGLKANAGAATLVDKGTFGGNPADDILGVNIGAIPSPLCDVAGTGLKALSTAIVRLSQHDTRDRHLASGTAHVETLPRQSA
jgi:hypothetical protein